MQKITYITLFVIGIFSAFWLFYLGDETTLQDKNATVIRPLIDSNTVESLNKVNDKHPPESSETLNTSTVIDGHCDEFCNKALEWLNIQNGLTDEEFEKAMSMSDDLAIYLSGNPDAVVQFLELASTDDGDKRSFLMEIFNQLDVDARLLLGEVFLESTDFRNRYDGVTFLAQPEIMHEPLTQRFSEMLAVESDQLVRNALIQAFNQPEKFYADRQVLDILEKVSNDEADSMIRGEALLARVQLEEDPEQVFADSIEAIRSDIDSYQLYGLRALEQIIKRQNFDDIELSQEVEDEARHLFDELRNAAYDSAPIDVLSEANNIYVRHFAN